MLLAAQLTESSATTHATTEAVDACRYFAGLVVGALTGASKTSLVAPRFARVGVAWDAQPLCERVSRIAAGSYVQKTREQIRSTW